MSDLLDFALASHGGLDRWRAIRTVTATLTSGGALFDLKGYGGGLGAVAATADSTIPRLTFTPFAGAARGVFELDRVAVTMADGGERWRENPRAAFADVGLETPWDDLHLLYFTGYAMWNYLCTPFLLTWPGFEVAEIEPWNEGAETWRRLRVHFPHDVPTHSAEQVLYFDDEGLLRRLDYTAEVVSAIPVAHYCYDHQDFSGLVVPTRRRVLRRRDDGTAAPEPVFVEIDIAQVTAA